jgi:hypothetical protein
VGNWLQGLAGLFWHQELLMVPLGEIDEIMPLGSELDH